MTKTTIATGEDVATLINVFIVLVGPDRRIRSLLGPAHR